MELELSVLVGSGEITTVTSHVKLVEFLGSQVGYFLFTPDPGTPAERPVQIQISPYGGMLNVLNLYSE